MFSLSLQSLEFDMVPYTDYSSRGLPFRRYARVGMPRVPQNVVDSVFFLYPDKGAAEAGQDAEGTGFIAAMPSRVSSHVRDYHFYAISNRHVIEKARVVRINAKSGKPAVFNLTSDDWNFCDAGDDVAAAYIEPDFDNLAVAFVDTFSFVDDAWIAEHGIGVGEDVFMMGLFIDHEASKLNVPLARFGNIAMMPNDAAQLVQPHGVKASDFILDMHSRSGYSGSPVFVFRTIGADLTKMDWGELSTKEPTLFRCLGVHWGQFPETFEKDRGAKIRKEKWKGMSGMSCAIPAWRIKAFLETHPVLSAMRAEREQRQMNDPEVQSRAVPMQRQNDA